MTELLPNYAAGRWQTGQGPGAVLQDPVLGHDLVRVDATGLDLPEAFRFAREQGGSALRALTYRQRAALLGAVVKVLQTHRDAYYEIATANSGTVKNDSAVDIDGGIFTLGQYAKWGDALGDVRALRDGDAARLGKEPVFLSQHLQVPARGVALFINAFNFPAWGLWEKAAPALLSGVPVIVKPATSTAWLTQRMVRDVVDAGVLPAGALSVIAGSSAGLMDQLAPFDVVSFTGSADTAGIIRAHPAVARRSVRANIEADSLNSALLLPDAAPGSDAFNLLVREVVREMTVKSGQKCTAIRRILVPAGVYGAAAEAIGAKLAGVTVGNPATTACAWARSSAPPNCTPCARGWRSCAPTPTSCTTAGRRSWWTQTPPWRPASARCCWVRATPIRRPWCTTSRCSARWPRWCLTAMWTMPWRSHSAARGRWWHRCTAPTRPRWGMPPCSSQPAMAACTW